MHALPTQYRPNEVEFDKSLLTTQGFEACSNRSVLRRHWGSQDKSRYDRQQRRSIVPRARARPRSEPPAAETERRSRIGLGRHHERTGRPACAEIISCVLSGGLRRRLCRANASGEPGAHTGTRPDRPDLAELFRSQPIRKAGMTKK